VLARPSPSRGRLDSRAHDVEHVLDARLAGGGESPQVGAPDHHRLGSQRQGLDHVAAAPDAAVEQHLDVVANRLGDCRERADRGGSAIEVLAPVADESARGAGTWLECLLARDFRALRPRRPPDPRRR
jgi:hypothetical protein